MSSWDMWNLLEVQMPTMIPPKYNKLPRRPKKLRKMSKGEPPAGSLGKKH